MSRAEHTTAAYGRFAVVAWPYGLFSHAGVTGAISARL